MLIIEDKKAVVLHLSQPERVTTVIPGAKKLIFQGKNLVVVKHGVDESIVLRNLGFKVSSPIKYQYVWPRNVHTVPSPFKEQKLTAEFLTLYNRAFVLSEPGCGKTLAALWAADFLREQGKANKILIVATLSTLNLVWAREIAEHLPHLNVAVLHGTKDKRLKMLAQDADAYIINHDGICVLSKELAERKDIDIVIVDEIASFRNYKTNRWKALNHITSNMTRVWGLTGTPTPNAPTDAFGQVRLISPQRVPRYFGAFRDKVMRQYGPFKWLPRDEATDIVHEAMQPAIRFTREEMVELPETMYEDREVSLSPDQRRMYAQMLRDLATSYGADTISAANDAVAASKLLQIASGVAYGAVEGSQIVLPCTERIALVKEIIEQSSAKVIVFAPFRSVVDMLEAELGKDYTVGKIHGGTTKSSRDGIFTQFQGNSMGLRVIVAHPGTMAHGLNLTAADTVIWYAPVYSNEIYEQANARITRPGQKRKQLIFHIQSTEMERRIYKRLRNRQRLQGLLLDLVKGGFDL